MDIKDLGQNLRWLRDAKGFSQSEVAERAEVSRVAYGAIEAGTSRPRVDTLLRIAGVLDVKLEDLLAPPKIVSAVRFRATKRMNTRDQILFSVGRWLESYTELEKLVGATVPYAFGKPISIKAGPNRAKEAASWAREILLDSDGCIRDICGLLEDKAGVKVYTVRFASDTFFGLSVAKESGGPAIVVNTWERISVERWIFTSAHELGHLLLHLSAYDVEHATESEQEEKEADQFASHFLMPDEVFEEEWEGGRGLSLVQRVHKVKQIFKVSYKTVLYRVSESKKDKSIWSKYYAEYQREHGRSLRKTDEPDGLSSKQFQASEPHAADEPKRIGSGYFVGDRLSSLVRLALDKEAISVSRAAEILEIDLREMRARIASWTP